jgi:hypothetical protein
MQFVLYYPSCAGSFWQQQTRQKYVVDKLDVKYVGAVTCIVALLYAIAVCSLTTPCTFTVNTQPAASPCKKYICMLYRPAACFSLPGPL